MYNLIIKLPINITTKIISSLQPKAQNASIKSKKAIMIHRLSNLPIEQILNSIIFSQQIYVKSMPMNQIKAISMAKLNITKII